MADQPQQVIVYRSRMEQQQDQFWMEHQDLAMWVFGPLVLLIIGFWLKNWISIGRDARRMRKNWPRGF